MVWYVLYLHLRSNPPNTTHSTRLNPHAFRLSVGPKRSRKDKTDFCFLFQFPSGLLITHQCVLNTQKTFETGRVVLESIMLITTAVAAAPPVTVQAYTESLCIDCKHFVDQHLVHTYHSLVSSNESESKNEAN